MFEAFVDRYIASNNILASKSIHFCQPPLPHPGLAVAPVPGPVRLLALLATVPRPHTAAALQQCPLGVAVPADPPSAASLVRACCGSIRSCGLLAAGGYRRRTSALLRPFSDVSRSNIYLAGLCSEIIIGNVNIGILDD